MIVFVKFQQPDKGSYQLPIKSEQWCLKKCFNVSHSWKIYLLQGLLFESLSKQYKWRKTGFRILLRVQTGCLNFKMTDNKFCHSRIFKFFANFVLFSSIGQVKSMFTRYIVKTPLLLDIFYLYIRGKMKNLLKKIEMVGYPGKWDLAITDNLNVIGHHFL